MPLVVDFIIDGFNLYHSAVDVEDKFGSKVKWLDLRGVSSAILKHLGAKAQLGSIYYFSAEATHRITPADKTPVIRHQKYMSCLKDSGVEVSLGYFKKLKLKCKVCGQTYPKHEEKETDVALSLVALERIVNPTTDLTLIVSGDTDCRPLIDSAERLGALDKLGFVFPFGRRNRVISRDQRLRHKFTLAKEDYTNNQLPDPYTLADGRRVYKPKTW